MLQIKPDVARIEQEIIKFSEFIDPEEEGFTRISFSEQYQNATTYLAQLMAKEAGLSVRKDAAAEIVLSLEKVCRTSPEIVGTVGQMRVLPNASNGRILSTSVVGSNCWDA